MLNLALLTGAVPALLSVVGGAALLYLLFGRRDRRWWLRVVPVVVLAAAYVVAWVATVLVVVRPFPDPLPAVVWCSLGVALIGVGLAAARTRRTGRLDRVLAATAAVLVLGAAANQVNRHFGEFPTVRAALGLREADQVEFTQVSEPAPILVYRPARDPLSRVWRAPSGMPPTGAVSQVRIPATVSHFGARPGWVYLPPAYLGSPRARLPVLVLLGGQPGSARDWLDGGRLAMIMDRFAAAHAGLAPVVVMPDMLGAALANPLCMDSRLGNAQTYLSVDVPAWTRATLQVDPDPASWAVGGFSAGGTCALQLAVNTPRVYPTFVDISGQSEPSRGGDRASTVAAAFGGDAAAFRAVNPLDLLAARRYPDSAGIVLVGGADNLYRPQADRVTQATRHAGMQVQYRELPGEHTWRVWAPALEVSLPWLAERLRLITP